ncbi:MAG: penicillin acylase family protein [Desulfobacter sp.]|nr:MAG: penicillin acylase family protein [Desulfobacter sp.]
MKKGISIQRDHNGIPRIKGNTMADIFWGQGYAHAKDRGLQMLLMRILGQGRGCEFLDSGDEMLAIDTFFRKMNWGRDLFAQTRKLSPAHRDWIGAYCDGANAAFLEKLPWELKLLGYRHEPWRPEHSLLLSRMMGYLTLAQSQGEMERLFVEMVQAGISRDKLEDLFPGLLDGLDIQLLKKVSLGDRIVEPPALWNRALPRMMASNNWVVAGSKTASGKPILCNDPHLEINRLPNVWYELVMEAQGRYNMGASMPGMPGVLAGRSGELAWGVTYAFIDSIDSWIENCRDGKYYREDRDQWIPFDQRTEVIERKKKEPKKIIFYENGHGVLDGDPNQEGCYLATRWAAADSGGDSLSALFGLWDADTVETAMDSVRRVETGWSFVLADTSGSIGFQMTGKVPKRNHGTRGFIPLPGWKAENDWQGFIDPDDLPRKLNPSKGFFSTANQNLNAYGKAAPITVCMGAYRSERIDRLLEGRTQLTREEMYAIHGDLYSIQAEQFMAVIRPLLPETPQGDILKAWDLCYDKNSKGAFLFERIYARLYKSVFGENGFGIAAMDYLSRETGIFIDFYDNFDRILLTEASPWFNGRSREDIFKAAIDDALDTKPRRWGRGRRFPLSHILFGGKLPGFLGFDRGPVTGIGGRATIHQGQIYKSAGRTTTFMPSIRMVSDLAEPDLYSNMPGGPSDRRFSKWYVSDLGNWLKGRYKKLSPDPAAKHPF